MRNGLVLTAFLGHQQWVLSCPEVFKLFPDNLGHLQENIEIMIICVLFLFFLAFSFLKMSYVLMQFPFSLLVRPRIFFPWWFLAQALSWQPGHGTESQQNGVAEELFRGSVMK